MVRLALFITEQLLHELLEMTPEQESVLEKVMMCFPEAVCQVCGEIGIPINIHINFHCNGENKINNCRQNMCLKCTRRWYGLNKPPTEKKKLPECIICHKQAKRIVRKAEQAYSVDFRLMDDIDNFVRGSDRPDLKIKECICDNDQENIQYYTLREYYQHIRESCPESLAKCSVEKCRNFLKRGLMTDGYCDSCNRIQTPIIVRQKIIVRHEIMDLAEDSVVLAADDSVDVYPADDSVDVDPADDSVDVDPADDLGVDLSDFIPRFADLDMFD